MYVTRPLSLYKNSPEALLSPPPEGPNSGYLVIDDDESIPTCFGLSNAPCIKELPFPSNKVLKIHHGPLEDEVFAIPVLGQPLSLNHYYLIKARRKHKGKAYACSNEEDRGASCGKRYVEDKKPSHHDPEDIYQQFELSPIITCTNNNGFTAKSVALKAHVPKFLRNISSIQICNSSTKSNNLIQDSAKGLDRVLRSKHPDFDFPLTRKHSNTVCVGKWICPFIFIHDGKLEDQVKKSVYYEMTLEQRWERIFTTDNNGYSRGSNKVMMDVVVPIKVVEIGGKDADIDDRHSGNKATWFRTIGSVGDEISVGLSSLIVERMIWEQKRVGWVNVKGNQVRIVKEEEYGGIGWWVRYGCFVLVERFVLRRMDGSLVLTFDFMHTHQIKTKWE